MQLRTLIPCLTLAFLFGCGTPQVKPEKHYVGEPDQQLRTSEQVSQALARAQAAYLEGQWGDTVVQANRVMEGAASTDEYYLAVKLLGMASCNRKDPAPVAFSWSRLKPPDQQGLRRECEHNGLSISDMGEVARKGGAGPGATP